MTTSPSTTSANTEAGRWHVNSYPPEKKLNLKSLVIMVAGLIVLTALTVYRLGSPWSLPQGDFEEIFRGPTMGTDYTVKLIANPRLTQTYRASLAAEFTRLLEDIDLKMSTYRPDSELSRFNASQSTEPFPVSERTLAVFLQAREVSEATGGAFDVTVGPLVSAWGFGAHPRIEPPADDELAEIRARVGFDKIEIDAGTKTLRKTAPLVECDLSAIAPGYAVDEMASLLELRGFDRYLIELGGEIRAAGTNLQKESWTVAIEKPLATGRVIQRVVPLSNASLATSGDYRNFYERDGQRYSHTIDPRTGRPVTHTLASISVIHESCATADAFATALNVLGPEAGFQTAETFGLPAVFIIHEENDVFAEKTTTAFDAEYGNR